MFVLITKNLCALKAKNIFVNEAIPNLFWKLELHKDEIKKLKEEALKMSSEAIAYATLAMRDRKDFSKEILENPLEYMLIHGTHDKLVSISDLESRINSLTQLNIITNEVTANFLLLNFSKFSLTKSLIFSKKI